jgi:hypothetical protein
VYESARLTSPELGSYYHPLSRAQSLAASRRGWTLLVEGRAEEGNLFGEIDHEYARRRYALNLYRNPGGFDVARLLTASVPVQRGLEWPIPGPPGERHRLHMTQAAGSETADLWVDGVKRLTGAPGVDDYRYHRGVEVGVAKYRSVRAAGVIWKFRLEIG